MKSSAIPLVGIFIVLLVLTIFVVSEKQISALSLEKISLEDNTIRIQKSSSEPVVDIQLIENTEQCLVDCYAILKFHPHEDILLPYSPGQEFRWDFVKAEPDMSGLRSYSFEILTDISYDISIPIYENISYICRNNQTDQNQTCWRMERMGSEKKKRYKKEYRPFSFWGQTLKANQDYYIKLKGKKYATLEPNSIDWIPTIKGLEISEWATWHSGWTYAKGIRIDTSGLSSNLTDFTTNISINTSELIANNKLLSNCNDLRFVSNDNSTELKFHLENDCNDNNLNTTIWVKIPEIDRDNTTTIWMYYGNDSAGNVEDEENTYDENYVAVWHMNESATMSFDSTNYSNDGSMNSVNQINGWFAKGHNFSQTNGSYTNISDSNSLDQSNNFTIEAWVNTREYDLQILMKDLAGSEVGDAANYYFQILDPGNTRFWFEDSGHANYNYLSDATLNFNEWYYVAATYDNSNNEVRLYINDTIKTHTGVTAEPDTNTYPVVIADYYDGSYYGLYDIDVDELRISNVVRSEDYFKANWNALYITIGSEITEDNVVEESQGRDAIESGIKDNDALGPEAVIYEDQQIYVRNSTDHKAGTFDVVTQLGNQTWAFNYITENDTKTGVSNLTTVLYIWEEANLSSSQIENSVTALISQTKV